MGDYRAERETRARLGPPWLRRQRIACNMGDPSVGKMPRRREWLPIPVFLPGESHGQRSLEGYWPRGPKESDTTERLTLLLFLRGTVWLTAGPDRASQAVLTTAAEILTGADLALCDVQDEGVWGRAEVAGALRQGEMGGVEESHTPLGVQARGPRGSDSAGQEPSTASFPGSWLCPCLALLTSETRA